MAAAVAAQDALLARERGARGPCALCVAGVAPSGPGTAPGGCNWLFRVLLRARAPRLFSNAPCDPAQLSGHRRTCASSSSTSGRRCASTSSRATRRRRRSRAQALARLPARQEAPDKRPFGTQLDVYARRLRVDQPLDGAATPLATEPSASPSADRDCTQPYSARRLQHLGDELRLALGQRRSARSTRARKLGGFAHDTGEGSFSPYHRVNGGDLDLGDRLGLLRLPQRGRVVRRRARSPPTRAHPQVKMIEIKLSQGAKPGHGGMLPARKVTRRDRRDARRADGRRLHLARARTRAFATPLEMMQFIARLRELSGGKPTGFKLCIGHPWEWFGIAKAMRRDRHHARLHRRRRRRRRHRRGAARVHRPRRRAAAGRAAARAQHAGRRSACATASSIGARRQGHHRLRHRAHAGARRRLVQRGARLHVRARLHPGAELPHRPLPHRRHQPRQVASARAGRVRQGRARRQFSQGDGQGAGRACRGGRASIIQASCAHTISCGEWLPTAL